MIFLELFGLRLKSLRLKKGLTQSQLAKKLELTRSSISYYEKNAVYPSIEILIKICRYFDVSADFLIGLSNDKEFQISHLTDEQVQAVLNIIRQFEQLNN